MAPIVTVEHLPAKVLDSVEESQLALMIDGANAKASRVAPCLASADPEPTAEQLDEARLILVGAIIRWSEAGSGALQQQSAGPFSVTVDTRQRDGYNLWPSEVTGLQEICRSSGSSGGAFTVDTAPPLTGAHAAWCSMRFGAAYCSCGVDIAGVPIFGGG